jgi:hypothetical protein
MICNSRWWLTFMLWAACCNLGWAQEHPTSAELVKQLGDRRFATREAATAALDQRRDEATTQMLVAAVERVSDAEARQRLQQLLDRRGWLTPALAAEIAPLIAQLHHFDAAYWSPELESQQARLVEREQAFATLLARPELAVHQHLAAALSSSATAKLKVVTTINRPVIRLGEGYQLVGTLRNEGPGGVWLPRSLPRPGGRGTVQAIERAWLIIGEPQEGRFGSRRGGRMVIRTPIACPLHGFAYLPAGAELKAFQIDFKETNDYFYGTQRWGWRYQQTQPTHELRSTTGQPPLTLGLWTGDLDDEVSYDLLPPRVTEPLGVAKDGLALGLTSLQWQRGRAELTLELVNTTPAPMRLLDPRRAPGKAALWYLVTLPQQDRHGGRLLDGNLIDDSITLPPFTPVEELDVLPAGQRWVVSVTLHLGELPPGSYELLLGYGRLTHGNDLVNDAWQGEVYSNTIVLTVPRR